MVKEFRDAALLWFVNSIIHVFGWALFVVEVDGKTYLEPRKCEFRGFPQDSNTLGYFKLTKYMEENAGKLMEDFSEEEIQEIMQRKG